MYVDFHELPKEARVWVFTAGRILSAQERDLVSKKLRAFIETWQSHQKDMKASFLLAEERFIVIAADESYNDISGCGIDKAIHIVQELEQELAISLMDKTLVVFENKGNVLDMPFNKIKDAASKGILDAETFFYNTLASNVGEFTSKFRIQASEGWVKKYFISSVLS